MSRKNVQMIFVLLSLFAAALACGGPASPQGPSASDLNATQVALSVQMTLLAQQSQPTVEQAVAPVAASATVTQQVTPSLTPEPLIEHLTRPGEPARIRTWVSDISSEVFAPERRTIGDSLPINLLERPFTADEMTYQPYLDITKVEVGEGDVWIYVVLHLEGTPPEGASAFYAVEIDTDRDGRGDWLIGGLVPPSSEWTTDGVKVWRDSNEDVGGFSPMSAEAPLSGLDGYDQLVFDAGRGDDPDAAWIRRDPSHPDRVQLAFKLGLIESPGTFLWGGWCDEGVQQPGWFDYNDRFTLQEAGSPAINNENYPLAALYSVDNTCRWSYGFEPKTDYPGLCPLPTPTPTPTSTPRPTVCSPPPEGCPRFVYGNTTVQYVWNPETCECEAP